MNRKGANEARLGIGDSQAGVYCINVWVIFPFILGLSQSLTKDLGLVHVSTTKRDLERAQQRALKMIKGLKNDTYNEMLGNFYYLAWREKNWLGDSWIVIQVYVSLSTKE